MKNKKVAIAAIILLLSAIIFFVVDYYTGKMFENLHP